MADLELPHDLDAERAVLGAVMLEPERFAEAASVIGAGDFFRHVHRFVWEAMVGLHETHCGIDFVTVRAALEGAQRLEEVGLVYLSDLTNGVPRSVNIATYARIVRDHSRTRMQLAILDRARQSLVQGGGSSAAIADVAGAFARLHSSGDALVLTGVGELLAEGDSEVDWLVEDRFACGSINLLAGRPKAGKSTAARALALAVSRGDRWLGSRCRFGRVVYVAMEDKRSEVRRHFRAMGATGQEPVRFVFDANPKTLLADLSAMLAAGDQVDMLVVDTVQRLVRVKDSNDYSEVTAALVPILELARQHGVCVILLHHAGKSDRAGLESVLGSTAWSAGVDNVILLNRTDRYRLVSSIQRIGPDLDESVVLMDEATGEVRMGGSRWLVDVQMVADAMKAAVCASGPEGIRRDQLLADTEARRELKLKALHRLGDDLLVERVGAGTKNDPYRYRLAPEPASGAGAQSDGGSRVPYKEREPESPTRVSRVAASVDGGSRMCAGSEGVSNGERL